jgi:hypothetical protein
MVIKQHFFIILIVISVPSRTKCICYAASLSTLTETPELGNARHWQPPSLLAAVANRISGCRVVTAVLVPLVLGGSGRTLHVECVALELEDSLQSLVFISLYILHTVPIHIKNNTSTQEYAAWFL